MGAYGGIVLLAAPAGTDRRLVPVTADAMPPLMDIAI